MRFRNILALILVLLVGFFLLGAFTISPENGEIALSNFGEAEIGNRTAQKYINKNVNTDNNEIIYKESKNEESGSANMVTSVVANYRSLDTLGEVSVLFLAATGVGAVLYSKNNKEKKFIVDEGSLILKTGIDILFPLLILAGAYIFIHGHLSPGGGFQGGAVIATAFLLKFLANKDYELAERKLKIVEGLAGVTFVALGLYGLAVEGSFLANFLNTGVVGELFSAGIIPIIYIAIGLKVGSELTNIISNLIEA
ncbi:MAG: MnhB domain-containing protein [Bacillota bacterium]